MSRRPRSLAAYARRRWRAVGLIVVLLLGALLVSALTDRGHDPLWTVRGGTAFTIALSDNADTAYRLRTDEGRITALEARRGETGALLWTSPMNDPRALIDAGDDWVAVATDFPRAFLTKYGEDNSVRFQVALEGNPRAIAGDGARVVLALQAPGNPVLVFEGSDPSPTTYRFSTFVNALDARGDRIAVGTGQGDIVVLAENGTEVLNASLPINVRSLRLNDDGTRLVVGGFSLRPGDLSGLIVAFDLDHESPLRWSAPTRIGVGYVDLDAAGHRAIAVEESPPRNTVHAFDFTSPIARWSRLTEGEVAQDDSGTQGGVALSPDGEVVAIGTIHGRIELVSAATGELRWTYRIDGTTAVAFGESDPTRLLVNARLSLNGPYDGLLLFSTREEPPLGRLGLVAGGLTLLAAASLALVIGVGYARLRRG